MAVSPSTLATKDLHIGIGSHPVAQCGDVSVEAGQVLVLIGKNGAGKSTFLRTICGLLKPLTGEITFGGRPQNDIRMEQTVAWLSQEEHMEFAWTAREYVSLGRLAHNSGLNLTTEDQDAVEDALRLADASSLAERRITELSGGERQRVRLARALAQDTPLIVMDEPTTHVDLEHQIQFLVLIEKLASQGKSIVISLHDVLQSKQIGTQFLLFKDGRAAPVESAEGLTKELLEETLGVRFEQLSDGQLMPIYGCRTTGST